MAQPILADKWHPSFVFKIIKPDSECNSMKYLCIFSSMKISFCFIEYSHDFVMVCSSGGGMSLTLPCSLKVSRLRLCE